MPTLKVDSRRFTKVLETLQGNPCHLTIKRHGQVKVHYLLARITWHRVASREGEVWLGTEGDGTISLDGIQSADLSEADLPGQSFLHFHMDDGWTISLQF